LGEISMISGSHLLMLLGGPLSKNRLDIYF